MDLCFADSESMAASGFVDDNGGLDYHVPIEGAGKHLDGHILCIMHCFIHHSKAARQSLQCLVDYNGGLDYHVPREGAGEEWSSVKRPVRRGGPSVVTLTLFSRR